MIDDKLSEVFGTQKISWVGVKPAEVITTDGYAVQVAEGETPEETKKKEVIDSDFDQTRKNLTKLMESGQEALQDAMILARSSEDPKSWQVVSNIITQIAAINEQLMDIHLKKQQHELRKTEKAKKVEEVVPNSQSNTTTNQAIFVGSNAELAQLIAKMTNKG